MKRYSGLFIQTTDFRNLHAAAQLALRGKRDRGQVARFFFHLENELIRIQSELVAKTYLPQPYRQFEIREPKIRQICSSDFRDRVVHHAVCRVIDLILEARLIHDTYACRVGKGAHSALRRCQNFTRRYRYSLKCDVRKYFESIDHCTCHGRSAFSWILGLSQTDSDSAAVSGSNRVIRGGSWNNNAQNLRSGNRNNDNVGFRLVSTRKNRPDGPGLRIWVPCPGFVQATTQSRRCFRRTNSPGPPRLVAALRSGEGRGGL